MIKRKNRETDSFTVSFLDVASCGFGAMIILLMITKSSSPTNLEYVETERPDFTVSELQEQLFAIRGETTVTNRELNAKREQLSANKERIARLRRDLEDVQGRYNTDLSLSIEVTNEMGNLQLAQESLSEQLQRLLAGAKESDLDTVGGVPIDSEYLIFVIDTSGSMKNYGRWEETVDVIRDALEVYPNLQGIQVLSDNGEYLFNSFRGEWIPDDSARRDVILQDLLTWNAYSCSNPSNGITRAIEDFYEEGLEIGIWVIGDDFNGGCPGQPDSTDKVLDLVDSKNRERSSGDRLVRIHGVGFPNNFDMPNSQLHQSAINYFAFMRELTERNGGTFISLGSPQDRRIFR